MFEYEQGFEKKALNKVAPKMLGASTEGVIMRKYLGTSVLMFVAIMVSGACLGTFEAKAEEASVHPGDVNTDWRMVMSEAIGYLSGWQNGDNPMAYAIRAAYLWQNGEAYRYTSDGEPPLCWILAL